MATTPHWSGFLLEHILRILIKFYYNYIETLFFYSNDTAQTLQQDM